MTTYVEIHSPDQIISAAEFGYANYGATLTKTPPADRGRSKRPPRSKLVVNNDPSSPRNYCFVHGYSGHKGAACRFMLSDPANYISAHLLANVHTTVPGGSDSHL